MNNNSVRRLWPRLSLLSALLLLVITAVPSEAEQNSLFEVVAGSGEIARVRIQSGAVEVTHRDGASSSFTYTGSIIEVLKGSAKAFDVIPIIGNLSLKIGSEYLIFADIRQSPTLRYWELSSPFFFEVVNEMRGRRDSPPLLRAKYENEQLQLPEEVRLNIRRHGVCLDPDNLHLEASEDECPTVFIDAYVEWADLAEYIHDLRGNRLQD